MTGLSPEFQYLLDSSWLFVPKTKAGALKGVEGGFLPEAALVIRGVNVRPIFEEPYDLMELDRILAKPNLDLETVLLLMRVFEIMVKNPDKELALFAAESINTLEIRYVRRIQELKETLASDENPGRLRLLFRALYEMSVVNSARPILRTFYLNEALRVLENLWATGGPSAEDLEMVVQSHLDLNRPGDAETAVNLFIKNDPQNPHLFFLMARVKFFEGKYLEVMTILAFLKGNRLLPEASEIYRFWVGEDSHG